MLKKLLLTTALSGLMFSSAMAQAPSPSSPGASSPPPASSSSPPAASSGSSDTMKSDASKSGTSASTTGASGSAQTVSSQKPDQLLASKVRGADVVGSDDKKIGDVSDILFSKDGKIEAYVLSVGGFLGVGAKEVALAPSSIQMTQDKDTWKLKVSMTKDQLAQAPNFERHQDRSATTGAGGAGGGSATTPRSAPGGGMAPSGGSGAK